MAGGDFMISPQNGISHQLVLQKSDVFYLNILLSVVPTAAIALATFGVRASDSPTPPGRAATKKAAAFWPGIKKCMTSRAFVTLLLALGGGIGMFNALYTMMQQLLCAGGYSNSFAGVCCILMIGGGLCGATASASVVATLALINPGLKRTPMETPGKAMESKKSGIGGHPGPDKNGATSKIVERKVGKAKQFLQRHSARFERREVQFSPWCCS